MTFKDFFIACVGVLGATLFVTPVRTVDKYARKLRQKVKARSA
jgi:hypothetical protein